MNHFEKHLLQSDLRPHHAFADDSNDEFQIKRENGNEQGIFKVWADTIIPKIEQNIAPNTCEEDTILLMEQWKKDLQEKPLSLFQCLDEWRQRSEIFDHRLQKIFAERDVHIEKLSVQERFTELFLRMEVAFKMLAPFYNIEALIADSRKNPTGNPINKDANEQQGGELDLVALLLPSALKEEVYTEELQWNDISWEHFDTQIASWRKAFLSGDISSEQRKKFIAVCKIAERAGVSASEVLFAANAMEFIPSRVGGKKDDVPWKEAIEVILAKLVPHNGIPTSTMIAREINARIRFLNWIPAQKSQENFQGRFWNYASVCDTAGDIFQMLLQKPEVLLQSSFTPVFLMHLVPQLEQLDASSARGRMILTLMKEGKFMHDVVENIRLTRDEFEKSIMQKLDMQCAAQSLIHTKDASQTVLVGGKALGLKQAHDIFDGEHIHEGVVLSTEAVNKWLMGIPEVSALIQEVTVLADPLEKIKIGAMICEKIHTSDLPEEMCINIVQHIGMHKTLVFRSSCFDEDVELIGPAPGIYESVLDVDGSDRYAVSNAIKEVVCSFFSEKAISFREMKGIRHRPFMAVLIQEQIRNTGGTVFYRDGIVKINVANRPDHIHHDNQNFEEWECSSDLEQSTMRGMDRIHESVLLDPHQFATLQKIALLAAEVFGPIDLEFVIAPDTKEVKILQMRKLSSKKVGAASEEGIRDNEAKENISVEVTCVEDLDQLDMLSKDQTATLYLDKRINIEKFQGALFIRFIQMSKHIKEIILEDPIPMTCHFANIVCGLGIGLAFKNSKQINGDRDT